MKDMFIGMIYGGFITYYMMNMEPSRNAAFVSFLIITAGIVLLAMTYAEEK